MQQTGENKDAKLGARGGKPTRSCMCIPAMIYSIQHKSKPNSPSRRDSAYRQKGILRKRYNAQEARVISKISLPLQSREDEAGAERQIAELQRLASSILPPAVELIHPGRLGKAHEALGSHPWRHLDHTVTSTGAYINIPAEMTSNSAEDLDEIELHSKPETEAETGSLRSRDAGRGGTSWYETESQTSSPIAEGGFEKHVATNATIASSTQAVTGEAFGGHQVGLAPGTYLDIFGTSMHHQKDETPWLSSGTAAEVMLSPVKAALNFLYRIQWYEEQRPGVREEFAAAHDA